MGFLVNSYKEIKLDLAYPDNQVLSLWGELGWDKQWTLLNVLE
jgi:hypothetical protein